VNYRHDPLLTFNGGVELTNQKVVPHHLAVPWFEGFQFLFARIFIILGARSFKKLVSLAFLLRGGVAGRVKVNIFAVDVGYCLYNRFPFADFVANFAHHVFLETARQIIGIGEIKPVVYLDALKPLYIVLLIFDISV